MMYLGENRKTLRVFPLYTLLFVIAYIVIILADRNSDVTFQFPEYDYKETSKNVDGFDSLLIYSGSACVHGCLT